MTGRWETKFPLPISSTPTADTDPPPGLKTVVILFYDEGEKYMSERFAARDEVRVTSKTFT